MSLQDDQHDYLPLVYNRMMKTGWLLDFKFDSKRTGFSLDFTDEGRRAVGMLGKFMSGFDQLDLESPKGKMFGLVAFIATLVHPGRGVDGDLSWVYEQMYAVNWFIEYVPGASPKLVFSPEGKNANRLLRELFSAPDVDRFEDEDFLKGFQLFLRALTWAKVKS